MKLFFISLLLFISGVVTKESDDPGPHYDCSYCQPEQIHLAFGEHPNDIVVTWSTFNDTGETRVQYGEKVMDKEVNGSQTLFVDGGKLRRSQWIHRVVLQDLKFDTRYVYHAGSVYGWSELLSFKTPPLGEDWTMRAVIYGDMGAVNAHSLSYLQDEVEREQFDVIIHVGDFAYDMDTNNALVGDEFMRQIQPIAAAVPYMTCPGNHESAYNFSNYRNRFSMPGGTESMFYSWNLGPVHFVSVNTEAYYFTNYGLMPLVNQYYWLEEDLKIANRRENRQKRPWIIMYGHRPMYCSDKYDDCNKHDLPNRVGIPIFKHGLEPLLKQYGVDLVIWAHEHSYERTWPLYDEKVYNGSYEHPYVNPRAPVHIITGSAGCQENTDPFRKQPYPWSAFHSSDYGYTRFVAHNKTHIYIEQVDVDLKGQVIDSMWLVKDLGTHGPAPVHIVTGSAGCQEGRDKFRRNPSKWSAFHSQDFGYTKMKVFNKSHINIEQVSVDLDGQVIDSIWLVKNKNLTSNML